MSCVVALVHSRGVILGADSAVVWGDTCTQSRKLFRVGQVWLGCVGLYDAIAQLVSELPRRADPSDLFRWASRHLLARRVQGLAVCRGQCLEFSGRSIVPVTEYAAIGAGAEFVFGAFHVARALSCSPRASVLAALRAAAAHSTGVTAPFDLVIRGQIRRCR